MPDGEGSVVIISDEPVGHRIDPKTGALSIDDDEGGTLVYLNPPRSEEADKNQKHFDNLAEILPDDVRMEIVEEVLRGIEADIQERQSWEDNRAEGIKMLGTLLEKPGGDAGYSAQTFEGMSTIRHPLLLEAITRAQANTAAELYPPSGPVKVRDDRPAKPQGIVDLPQMGHNGGPSLDDDLDEDENNDGDDPNTGAYAQNESAIYAASREDLAEALERGFNHNLT